MRSARYVGKRSPSSPVVVLLLSFKYIPRLLLIVFLLSTNLYIGVLVASSMVIITIGGPPGSGKSTLGRMLAARLGVPFFSMGDVRREYALKHGMTLAELNRRGETDPASDAMVDEYQAKLPETQPSFIIDSRLGYHFLPQSIKIYVKCDVRVAAQRIFAMRRQEERWTTLDDGVHAIQERAASDLRRYQQYYGLNPYSEGNFDLVIDSSTLHPLDVLHAILRFLRSKGVILRADAATDDPV